MMGKTSQISGSQASRRTSEKQSGENTEDMAGVRYSDQRVKLGLYQKHHMR